MKCHQVFFFSSNLRMKPLTTSWVITFTIWRYQTVIWRWIGNSFFLSSAKSCRYSTVWHIASCHAWQKSVQEAYHYYCEIGTAVYSSIMQSSLILSLTITCFTLARSLTLIYSSTLSAAQGEKTSSQHLLCQTVLCQYCIFVLVLYLRSHKLHSFSLLVLPPCVLSHKFLFLRLQSHGLVDLLLFWPIQTCHLAEREQPCILISTVYSPVLCCTHLLWNTHK